eukprot:7719804-Lingulodinium_polyedra.AAC.1
MSPNATDACPATQRSRPNHAQYCSKPPSPPYLVNSVCRPRARARDACAERLTMPLVDVPGQCNTAAYRSLR